MDRRVDMHTKQSLLDDLENLGIDRRNTSRPFLMKSIGEVEGEQILS